MITTHGGQVSIRFCHPLDRQMVKSPVNVLVLWPHFLRLIDIHACPESDKWQNSVNGEVISLETIFTMQQRKTRAYIDIYELYFRTP